MGMRKETVTKVIDGDSFRTSVREYPVRLVNVQSPEAGTAKGRQAARYLRSLIGGQEVEVQTVARDIYGRSIAIVKNGEGPSINAQMNQKLRGE